MRAITVIPGQAGSAQLDDVPEPSADAGAVLVDGIALGICGTDSEIVGGHYGWAPAGAERTLCSTTRLSVPSTSKSRRKLKKCW